MNLYIGNLPANATESALKSLFEFFGNVTDGDKRAKYQRQKIRFGLLRKHFYHFGEISVGAMVRFHIKYASLRNTPAIRPVPALF